MYRIKFWIQTQINFFLGLGPDPNPKVLGLGSHPGLRPNICFFLGEMSAPNLLFSYELFIV